MSVLRENKIFRDTKKGVMFMRGKVCSRFFMFLFLLVISIFLGFQSVFADRFYDPVSTSPYHSFPAHHTLANFDSVVSQPLHQRLASQLFSEYMTKTSHSPVIVRQDDWGIPILSKDLDIKFELGEDVVTNKLKVGSEIKATTDGTPVISVFESIRDARGALFPKSLPDFPYEYSVIFIHDPPLGDEIETEFHFFNISGNTISGITGFKFTDETYSEDYILTGTIVPIPSVISTTSDNSSVVIPFRSTQKIDLNIKAAAGRTNWVLLEVPLIVENAVYARPQNAPPYVQLFAYGDNLLPGAEALYYTQSPSTEVFSFGENNFYGVGPIMITSAVSEANPPTILNDMLIVQRLYLIPF